VSELFADFSGLGIGVRGLPARLHERLAAAWKGFLCAPVAGPALTLVVSADDESPDAPPFTAKSMRSSVEGSRVVFRMGEGSATVEASGPVAVRLAPATSATQAAALVNLATAALAWQLPGHGGALLHAAGAVIDGRAYLLVGGEGAGKSTWTELAGQAGAKILGDDLVLVHRGTSGFDALASPLRAQKSTLRVPGRWPLAALLGAQHAGTPALREDATLVARARIAANMPFAVDGLGARDALEEILDRLTRDVPNRTLAFAPEPSFVRLLRESGL
jgi:hypothetical protein